MVGVLRVRVFLGRVFRPFFGVPFMSRRLSESLDNFAGLRLRLDRENQLHALMLSQRHFRRS